MELISFLGNDKENLGQITALVNRGEWESVILIKNKGTPNIETSKEYKSIQVDSSLPLLKLKEEIQNKLKPHLSSSFEVALSLASGTGKEHMAIISALLNIPVGIKITAFTSEGIEFLT
jgi:hypothetical protein